MCCGKAADGRLSPPPPRRIPYGARLTSWHHKKHEIILPDRASFDRNINRVCTKQVRALIVSE